MALPNSFCDGAYCDFGDFETGFRNDCALPAALWYIGVFSMHLVEGGQHMALTLGEANRMVQAAVAKAQELNVKISVAVCDIGGNLVAFNRMDGASAVSAAVAQGKAAASAGFGRASGTLQADSPVIQAVIAALGGRMLPARGAVPVVKSAELLGAIGASGATAEQDEQCAQAGAASI